LYFQKGGQQSDNSACEVEQTVYDIFAAGVVFEQASEAKFGPCFHPALNYCGLLAAQYKLLYACVAIALGPIFCT
jgi:hypothetical protein